MADLASITKQEIDLVSGFVALLKKECEALKQANVSPLADLAMEKAQLIEQLNNLERMRATLLGVPDGQDIGAAMARWLESTPGQPGIAANWKKLMDLAREAKALNNLNSSLVSMHLNQTSELLSALTLQPQKQSLYGSNGQASQLTGSRIVDSA
ncbi:flagella synthesis protein FlgN [Quatrionicoccus australiensis]|uniref:flagella synthesis protein FlgN n=1 Tax=Quatrionicoccus australiensis TaxID=138118 RepID=UPI001CFBD7D8|nr:flagellar protein FlgN [Quatrionicoccus australiensis]MCB4360858.1 flagellar protein FlgN [Quatrionicoccus australiensis]